MAEVLGVVAAASQLAEHIIGIVRLVQCIRDAPATVLSQTTSLSQLAHVVESIKTNASYQSPQVADILTSINTKAEAISTTLKRVRANHPDGKVIAFKKSLIAVWNDESITGNLNQIERDKTTLALCLTQIDADIQARHIQNLNSQLQSLRDRNDSALTDEQWKDYCRAELYITNPVDDRAALIRTKGQHSRGTCTWITEHPKYQAWLKPDSSSPLLWIHGAPGKGKTMLSIFLTEEFEKTELYTDGPSLQVIYFFCDNRDNRRNTASSVLRGLMLHLLQSHPNLVDHVLPDFRTQKSKLFEESSFESLWRIFHALVRHLDVQRIHCVVDGIDELQSSALDVLLPKLRDLPSSRLRMIVVSRHFPKNIGEALDRHPHITLDPESDAEIRKDVEAYLHEKVDELSQIKQYPPSLKQFVLEILQARSEGTFLWISFALNLLRKVGMSETESCLQSLPVGLDAIYARILRGVDKANSSLVAKMLQWATLAIRPLELEELGTALKIQPTTTLSLAEVTRDKLQLCSGLLLLDDSKITLVHQSFKDYLLRPTADAHEGLEIYQVNPDRGNCELADVCLRFLDEKSVPYDQYQNILLGGDSPGPFLNYAANYWVVHARDSPCFQQSDVPNFCHFLDGQGSNGCSWIKSYSGKTYRVHYFYDWGRILDFTESKFLVAIVLGFTQLAMKWRPKPRRRDVFNISRKRQHREMILVALCLAAAAGDTEMVQSLLSDGADVNKTTDSATQNITTSPLHLAVAYKRDKVVKILLPKISNVDIKDSDEETPLSVAAERNASSSILNLLVSAGASVSSRNFFRRTPLHYAAGSVNEKAVEVLLKAGADPCATDDDETTPLHMICENRYNHNIADKCLKIVDLLLESGAVVNARGWGGETPLHNAIERWNLDTVQHLIKNGADVDMRTNAGETCLHFAARCWQGSVVEFLIQAGASVNVKTNEGETPLHHAVKFGSDAIVELLIQAGASVNAKTNKGETPLQIAVQRTWHQIWSILLREGADSKAVDSEGKTPRDQVSNLLEYLRRAPGSERKLDTDMEYMNGKGDWDWVFNDEEVLKSKIKGWEAALKELDDMEAGRLPTERADQVISEESAGEPAATDENAERE